MMVPGGGKRAARSLGAWLFIITCIDFPIGYTGFRELPGCRNVPPNKIYWQIAADTEIGSVPGSAGARGRCHPAAEPHA